MLVRSRAWMLLVLLTGVLLGCGDSRRATLVVYTPDGTVALLLPERQTARYEAADRPLFTAQLTALCPKCTLLYFNAEQDAALQQQQADEALRMGAQVLVLDPVDSVQAATIADRAKAQGVPVIAYDRLILNSAGVSYYVSSDNQRVGEIQARSLIDRLNELQIAQPRLVVIHGSPQDHNATLYRQGAYQVFDPLVATGKLKLVHEFATPTWQPAEAQAEMQRILQDGIAFDAVYAANDGTAGGVVTALQEAGVQPLPPVTGQDADLAAIQRIVKGEQYMTVYKAIKPQAEAAAFLAFSMIAKQNTSGEGTQRTVDNGSGAVPAILLTPIVVTRNNLRDTVVRDGFWTIEQICTAEVRAACAEAGLQ